MRVVYAAFTNSATTYAISRQNFHGCAHCESEIERNSGKSCVWCKQQFVDATIREIEEIVCVV